VSRRGAERPLFHAEGAGGVWLNHIQPAGVRTLGRAFGQWVYDRRQAGSADRPLVVMAGDGRTPAAEALAALGEGLRWAGCQVIEGAAATAACVELAVQSAGARGGVWVGNPGTVAHEVHLTFFDEQGLLLCAGAGLEELDALAAGPLSRPVRRAGGLQRRRIEEDYLRKLAPWYHGLRPLRLVLDAASPAPAQLIERLAAPTACCILRRRAPDARLGEQIRREQAHLGVRIDGSAERCEVFDETGCCVPAEQWLVLLARFRLERREPGPVILSRNGQAPWKAAFEQLGLEVRLSADSRREMTCAARRSDALLASDATGRCWLDLVGPAMADGLQVVTLLLNLLSRSDQTLSEVLREAGT